MKFDYIIVGGGPAGSVLARKLSDNADRQVLLIEAGKPSQFEVGGKDYVSPPLTHFDIPLLWPEVDAMSTLLPSRSYAPALHPLCR